jgi:hypothetical protein
MDESGGIAAAYPFSATPTPHMVQIDDGAQVWAMCAIDALGISAMLGRDAVISSSDPATGEQVVVATFAASSQGRRRTAVWDPPASVVFVGQREPGGPAAQVCCGVVNFFADKASARVWSSNNPDVAGEIVPQAKAEHVAAQIFGALLEPGAAP